MQFVRSQTIADPKKSAERNPMKNLVKKMSLCFVVSVVAVSSSFAEKAKAKHDNATPINDVAHQAKKDNNVAVQDGSLTTEQGVDLNKKAQKVENSEQKNADMRHGLVSK